MYFNVLKKVNKFDNYILHSIREYLNNKYLDILMPLVTSFGDFGVVWIVIAILLGDTHRYIGFIVIITLIVNAILEEGIVKNIVKRVRPCNKYYNVSLLISRPHSYSFPSGHASSSFAASEVLSMYYPQYRLVFMAIAGIIALSRIYLYVHYPTDVIAGIIMGTLCSKFILTAIQAGYIQRILLCMGYTNYLLK